MRITFDWKIAFIASITAVTPCLIFFLLFFGKIDMQNMLVYGLAPSLCAFISAGLLGHLICYKANKLWGNYLVSILWSLVIVITSLIFWAVFISFFAINTVNGPFMAMFAGTVYGFITYPPGLIAGTLIWYLSKRSSSHMQTENDY